MAKTVTCSLTSELPDANNKMLEDIQYMPPGIHEINASSNGEPISLTVTVDSAAADRLDSYLQEQINAANSGSADRPFFDFNHEDREAAAWPTSIYWGGDDPITGGIRAKLDWSGAGRRAVEDKTFRRFSPSFIPDEYGCVVSSDTNMGGFVNRAAFQSIQPLFAKDSKADPTQKILSELNSKIESALNDRSTAQIKRHERDGEKLETFGQVRDLMKRLHDCKVSTSYAAHTVWKILSSN